MIKKSLKMLFLLLAVGCGMIACLDDVPESEPIGTIGDPNQTWSIYWYLCGSDLESEIGAATDDLYEMMEATLPENVNVVIQTGGAYQWQNSTVDETVTERYLYSQDGLELIDQKPLANMGEADTLSDFLNFCNTNYPADRTMVLFWNHGGGSVTGASFDENYGYDSLTLSEFRTAFSNVYELSNENPPVDVIGFDTCLMASIDTASTFSDIGNYLVASEEMEPGTGWYYTDWLQELGDEPGMDGARLGQIICDTYLEDCMWYWSDYEATLSVIDLKNVPALLTAYENMGNDALKQAVQNPAFLSEYSRMAEASENYGGNTRDQGYANMVDLGHLALNCSDLLPDSSVKVLEALDSCVLYKVNGDYHENASGLSCYHSYNGDPVDLAGYQSEGCSTSFGHLYSYMQNGTLDSASKDYVASIGAEPEEAAYVPDLSSSGEEAYPLYIDDDDYVVLELDPSTLDLLKGVYFQLAYVDEDEDMMLLLGQDNDIIADWDTGLFKDNFRGVWGAIDGYPVYMEVSYDTEDYTVYSVPILLNGEEYSLRVTYDFNEEAFFILGARKGLDDNGMADKNLRQLEPGDEITTIHYAATISGEDDFTEIPMDTFEVTEDTSFDEVDMGDGTFLMMFELVDVKNNTMYSEPVEFSVNGDYIDIEVGF